MEVENLLIKIKLSYNQFTRTEKKIADYVLANAESVPFMSITELADECSVAEASIHRFCNTLKVKGYQEFKMRLSISIKDGMGSDSENGRAGSVVPLASENELFSQILNYHINAIRETNALLDKAEIDKTVQLMTEAGNIYFMGVGNSMTTALEAQGKFLHITPKVSCIMDAHMQSMLASMLSERDMVVIISYSGATTDTVNIANIAKKAGARVAAITRYPKSALTKFADTVLICGSKEGPLEGGSMGGKMSQLHIIDILFQCYYARNRKESRLNNKLTAEANLDKFGDR